MDATASLIAASKVCEYRFSWVTVVFKELQTYLLEDAEILAEMSLFLPLLPVC